MKAQKFIMIIIIRNHYRNTFNFIHMNYPLFVGDNLIGIY